MTDDLNPYPARDYSVTGWVGWVVFAAVVIIVVGGFQIIAGLGALFRDEEYLLTRGGAVLTFDYTSWGWIHLIFGILLIIVGVALLQGKTWARVAALVLVAINLVAQFAWIPAQPFWAVVVIAVDLLVLYAITVHGREL